MLSFSGGRSAAQAKKDKKRLLSELTAQATKAYRDELAEIDKEVAETIVGRRKGLVKAAANCRTRAEQVVEQAGKDYADAVAKAREAAKFVKQATIDADRQVCQLDKQHVRDEAADQLAAQKKRRGAKVKLQREIRNAERFAERRSRSKATRGERLREADDVITANIEEELIPLWKKVRGQIKGTGGRSRLEAFEQYVEENPDEVIAARQRYADQKLAEDMAAYYQEAGPGLARGRGRLSRAKAA